MALSTNDIQHKRHSASWHSRYAECRDLLTEFRYAESRYVEWRYAKFRYAECRYAKCRGANKTYDIIKHKNNSYKQHNLNEEKQ